MKDSAWINQRIQVGREVCISYNSIRNQRTSKEIPFGAPLFRETMTMFECRLTQAKEVRREKTEKRKRSKKKREKERKTRRERERKKGEEGGTL